MPRSPLGPPSSSSSSPSSAPSSSLSSLSYFSFSLFYDIYFGAVKHLKQFSVNSHHNLWILYCFLFEYLSCFSTLMCVWSVCVCVLFCFLVKFFLCTIFGFWQTGNCEQGRAGLSKVKDKGPQQTHWQLKHTHRHTQLHVRTASKHNKRHKCKQTDTDTKRYRETITELNESQIY